MCEGLLLMCCVCVWGGGGGGGRLSYYKRSKVENGTAVVRLYP